jgi:hypothetical protein
MARQTIAEQLEKARQILDGAAEGGPDLAARLTQVGYTTAALSAGRTLYENAGGARTTAFAERGDQQGATATVNALRQKVESQYKTLAQIATTVFKDNPDAIKTLGLNDGQLAQPRQSATTAAATPAPEGEPAQPPTPRLSEAQAAFFDRARILYTNAQKDPAIAAELATVGYPATRLAAEQADLQALEDADIKQEVEKAEAKGSTAAQKAALTELGAWVSRFTGIVVPALKDRPDLLAKLGLKPRGGKR